MRLRQSWPAVARAENVAIWRAARSGNEEKLHALLEDSLDDVGRDPGSWVHARRLNWLHDRKGTSPLMAAASNKRGAAAVSVLLAARCVNVNAVDNTQQLNTALHYAAISNTDSVAAENLLLAGADAFRLNRKGHTPLDEARAHGRKHVARALLEHMTVHADWLYVRGRFRWKKCWGVLLACDAARSATELCIYQSPAHVRPEAVVLVDEHTSVFPFASTDSYCWLRHPFAFTTNKPVMWQSVRKQHFTRAPECNKTMTHERVETSHVVFAADDKANLDMWIRVLTPPPRANAARQSRRSENEESYYWPRESLAAEVVQAQPMEVGPLGTVDAAVFEPPIPVRNRSATAPASSPPLLTSPPTSPRSDGDRGISERRTLARRSRASSSPARQPALPRPSAVQATTSPVVATQSEEGARHEGTDDASSVATTADADEQDPSAPAFVIRAEEERDEHDQPTASTPSSAQNQGDPPEQATDQSEVQRTATPLADSAQQTRRPRELCMICVSAPRDAACAPCGHLAACHACLLTAVQTYRVCPICRARVRSVMRIYDA